MQCEHNISPIIVAFPKGGGGKKEKLGTPPSKCLNRATRAAASCSVSGQTGSEPMCFLHCHRPLEGEDSW